MAIANNQTLAAAARGRDRAPGAKTRAARRCALAEQCRHDVGYTRLECLSAARRRHSGLRVPLGTDLQGRSVRQRDRAAASAAVRGRADHGRHACRARGAHRGPRRSRPRSSDLKLAVAEAYVAVLRARSRLAVARCQRQKPERARERRAEHVPAPAGGQERRAGGRGGPRERRGGAGRRRQCHAGRAGRLQPPARRAARALAATSTALLDVDPTLAARADERAREAGARLPQRAQGARRAIRGSRRPGPRGDGRPGCRRSL